MTAGTSFLGYRRPDGRAGVRNHVLVVPTVICSASCDRRMMTQIGTQAFEPQPFVFPDFPGPRNGAIVGDQRYASSWV